jgi:TIR domain
MADDQFDIYISYAPEDEARVKPLVEELEWVGLKVWFRNQPATSAETLSLLRSRLGAGACHVVVWTNNSAASGRVQTEARSSSSMKRLIAVRLDPGIIPPKGTEAQAYADLGDWTGGIDHKGMKKLLAGVYTLTSKGVAPEVGEPPVVDAFPRVNNEFGAGEDNLTPEQKDERAWQVCLSYNTRTYYEHYLNYFPSGRYVHEANERIAKKKRTNSIVIGCAIVYIIVQILAAMFVDMNQF